MLCIVINSSHTLEEWDELYASVKADKADKQFLHGFGLFIKNIHAIVNLDANPDHHVFGSHAHAQFHYSNMLVRLFKHFPNVVLM